MSDQVVVSRGKLVAVADAIRAKTKTTEALTLDEMPSAIESIQGGGADSSIEVALIQKTITEYSNDNLTHIGDYAFGACYEMTSVHLPNMETAGAYAFHECGALISVNFPSLTKVPASFMRRCKKAERAEFYKITSIADYGFYQCTPMVALIIRTDSVCALLNTRALTGTKIASGTGYVYVPSSLVESYKSATNWTTYANQIRAIEDYPDITGG